MNADVIAEYAPRIIQTAGQVVAIAAIIAPFTPTPADDGILMAAKKILDLLACNWGFARNKK